MITVTFTRSRGQVRIDHVLNREDSRYFEPHLILVRMGYDAARFLTFADCAQSAIDNLADSHYSHLIESGEPCEFCESGDDDNCTCSYAGNYCKRVDLDDVAIYRVDSINWFAKRES